MWTGKNGWHMLVLLVIALAQAGTGVAAENTPAQTAASPSPVSQSHHSPSHHGGAHGTHGMVVFGEPGRIFASHLPLYRHPHDWQVVLELAPTTPAGQKMVDSLLTAGGLLTLEPERFDLFRLRPGATEPLQEFSGKLYRDHFERGGQAVQELRWQVKRTWLFEPVLVSTDTAPGHRYFRIGTGAGERKPFWLLHKVERRPDTDQILQVEFAGVVPPAQFSSDALLAACATSIDCKAAALTKAVVIWQDTDDLQ